MAAAVEHERAAEGQRYRFTVDEFARMGEAGIFTEDDRAAHRAAARPGGGASERLVRRHPESGDVRLVILVIEVADSSLRYGS